MGYFATYPSSYFNACCIIAVENVIFAQGQYRFEGPSFPTIQELILYQYQCGLPVTSRSGAVLKTPIHRELWELNNDDLLLLDKIGRVIKINVLFSFKTYSIFKVINNSRNDI